MRCCGRRLPSAVKTASPRSCLINQPLAAWITATHPFPPFPQPCRHKKTLKRRPFCFVTFANKEDAERALAESGLEIAGAGSRAWHRAGGLPTLLGAGSAAHVFMNASCTTPLLQSRGLPSVALSSRCKPAAPCLIPLVFLPCFPCTRRAHQEPDHGGGPRQVLHQQARHGAPGPAAGGCCVWCGPPGLGNPWWWARAMGPGSLLLWRLTMLCLPAGPCCLPTARQRIPNPLLPTAGTEAAGPLHRSARGQRHQQHGGAAAARAARQRAGQRRPGIHVP